MRDKLTLSKGIYSPLCGWEWYQQHVNDYPDGIPVSFEVVGPGIKQSITVKTDKVMREVVREVTR